MNFKEKLRNFKWKKKYFFYLLLFGILIYFAIPVFYLLKVKYNEDSVKVEIPKGYTNDASGLNLTKVDTIIKVPNTTAEIQIQLREILKYAKNHSLKISMAGARHSMGGHTMYPGGIVINMLPYKHMELDSTKNILTVGSGALWEDVLHFLDQHQRSVAVMQAFSSFSIGGSLSVNGHGWQKDSPPISSSVISFTLMNENGAILNCSRTENSELFRLVLGGYGLFGIILDVKLQVVPNTALQYKYIDIPSNNYVENYEKYAANNPNVHLVFGRLRITKAHFLEEASLNYFEKVNENPRPLNLEDDTTSETKRLVFRGSAHSEYGKKLRWNLENNASKAYIDHIFSRNEILDAHVSLIENKDSATTDLLHEYFIPKRNFNAYIAAIKPILERSKIDLLNITIRAVNKDTDSYMNYAREDVFGFVFLFNQKKNETQEKEMKILTNQLVDVALKNQGTFYLPYRLHIDKAKIRLVYPQSDAFFTLKRKYDPSEIFDNKFYEYYK